MDRPGRPVQKPRGNHERKINAGDPEDDHAEKRKRWEDHMNGVLAMEEAVADAPLAYSHEEAIECQENGTVVFCLVFFFLARSQQS